MLQLETLYYPMQVRLHTGRQHQLEPQLQNISERERGEMSMMFVIHAIGVGRA